MPSFRQHRACYGCACAITSHVIDAMTPPCKDDVMPYFTAKDESMIHYRDWGSGDPIVFVHGNNCDCEIWDYHMTVLAERGFRCVAPDKRGFGRSESGRAPLSYDVLADDLAVLLADADLEGATVVGHSMGAAEIARYLTRHGTQRVARTVLVGAAMPFVMQTDDNPLGVPAEIFAEMNAATLRDRPAYYATLIQPFFGVPVSPEFSAYFYAMSVRPPLRSALECARLLQTADLRADLASFTVPTMIVHGAADAFAPPALTSDRLAAAIPASTYRLYEGAAHGAFLTHRERFVDDLIAFVR
jgi:non-heme chloroperoxidase